jgi:hypothetical protein
MLRRSFTDRVENHDLGAATESETGGVSSAGGLRSHRSLFVGRPRDISEEGNEIRPLGLVRSSQADRETAAETTRDGRLGQFEVIQLLLCSCASLPGWIDLGCALRSHNLSGSFCGVSGGGRVASLL